MNESFKSFTLRDKAILAGLFLSRFDKKALLAFGFTGFMEAYNILGYSIGVPPLSIRGYRDEFDPYFPNPRKGWHKRGLRDYCKDVMNWASGLSFDEFKGLLDTFILDKYVEVKDIRHHKQQSKRQRFIFNRLITGKAAEEYFATNYKTIEPFQNYRIKDTTNMGCGFDFKLSDESDNYYIEVKGINNSKGSMLMTEKEYSMADNLLDRYCLFVVSNFKEKPIHHLFFNPLNNRELSFQQNKREMVQISYSINVSKTFDWR